ncbi:LOW QUALITY PROTEIN: TNFAIP3-interacting protein 1 [Bufo gargarizans]|uniref:LOW QUALITY PROTEIN: TNFAIP3-interacting protein 1 n=1 Tax=Bufo gargarizans TaxID=30331 RepID=UPI001CF136D3|nr:LOW QUALITY PROTEIN: TNFAIP3-interacting protein 1 [Bufo gargarizans]
MEGRSPYRIYDPGGSAPKFTDEQPERMAGILSLGELLEESQNVAHNLHQKAEALIKDTRDLQSSSSANPHAPITGKMNTEQEKAEDFLHVELSDVNDKESDVRSMVVPKIPASGSSSEFDVLDPSEKRKSPESRYSNAGFCEQNEDRNIRHHLQRMGDSLNMFAEESDRNRLLNHMSRLVLEFNRLADKVQKNEQRTSVLQTLCEQLRKENEDLRSKLEVEWNRRTRAEQDMRYENLELKKLLLDRGKVSAATNGSTPGVGETAANVENATHQQTAKLLGKPSNKDQVGSLLKKVKILEHQRTELLDVNKQWDQQFRSLKHQYEEKITSLRQKLSQAAKSESEQEAERDRKQRDFDRKLLLARDKIEEKESQIQKLESEIRDLKQKNKFLHDQLSSTSRQREYQEREISRLNKALEEALKLQGSAPRSPSFISSTEETGLLQRQELITQIDLLKQQVAIFEEDFKRERSDRERMNEEKEDLKREMEQLQTQLAQANTKLQSCQEELRREKENAHELSRPQATGERYIINHRIGPTCPPYQYPYSPPARMFPGYEDWPICYPPPVVGPEHSQVQDLSNAPPPAYQWRVANNPPRTELPKSRKEADGPKKGAQNSQRQT